MTPLVRGIAFDEHRTNEERVTALTQILLLRAYNRELKKRYTYVK